MSIAGTVLLGIGLILLIIGVSFLFFDRRESGICLARAQGRVMGSRQNKAMRKSGGKIVNKGMYVPIVYFDGHKASPRQGSNPPKYKPGQTVTVFYDPKDPSRIRLDERSVMKVCGWIFGGIGGVLILTGAIMIGFAG